MWLWRQRLVSISILDDSAQLGETLSAFLHPFNELLKHSDASLIAAATHISIYLAHLP
jgi:hypothetical protein